MCPFFFSLWVLCLLRRVCLAVCLFVSWSVFFFLFFFLPLVLSFGLGHLSLSIFLSVFRFLSFLSFLSSSLFPLSRFSSFFPSFLSLFFLFLGSLWSPISLSVCLHLSGSAGGGALIYLYRSVCPFALSIDFLPHLARFVLGLGSGRGLFWRWPMYGHFCAFPVHFWRRGGGGGIGVSGSIFILVTFSI